MARAHTYTHTQGYGTCTPTRGYGEYTPVEARPTLWDVEGGHNEINRVLMGVRTYVRIT